MNGMRSELECLCEFTDLPRRQDVTLILARNVESAFEIVLRQKIGDAEIKGMTIIPTRRQHQTGLDWRYTNSIVFVCRECHKGTKSIWPWRVTFNVTGKSKAGHLCASRNRQRGGTLQPFARYPIHQ